MSVADTMRYTLGMSTPDITRPYLVIPKLIEQPTWGGDYIVKSKGWDELAQIKIGQSYELFSGSNLSLLTDSASRDFHGEITDNKAVELSTAPPDSIQLSKLVAVDPTAVLGEEVARKNPSINLLIKYTQALGNSFQVHIPASLQHPKWLPKPESWYYFEPGCITLGIKPGIDWVAYEACCRNIDVQIATLGNEVQQGLISYEDARLRIAEVVQQDSPTQYVNTVYPVQGQLVDLSCGALHHSWEEDAALAPQGNILYELQLEAMDDVSTFRAYDKGKLFPDGSKRDLQINEYFEFIDRSDALNTPANHLPEPAVLSQADGYVLSSLMRSESYSLNKLLLSPRTSYEEHLETYKHLFVKNGTVRITAGKTTLQVTQGHSCFIPTAAGTYTVEATDTASEILVSFV